MPDATATGDIGGAPQGVRARAHAQLLADVSRIARNHLEESGAPGLSVRAIARELGLASSALYRPATPVATVLGGILTDNSPDALSLRLPQEIPISLQAQLDAMSGPLGERIDQNVLVLGVTQRAKLFGMISFELFGTFNTVFDDANALFAASLDLDLTSVGVI